MSPALRPLPTSLLRAPLLLLASFVLLSASPAFAGGDIVKCVDSAGHVTLTDSECGSADAQQPLAAPEAVQPALPAAPAPARSSAPRLSNVATTVQHDNWVSPRPRGRMLAGDAATLRAARSSLQALDEAMGSRRGSEGKNLLSLN